MNCEECWCYNYDEEYDEYYRIMTHHKGICPYFRQADDYYLPRKQ